MAGTGAATHKVFLPPVLIPPTPTPKTFPTSVVTGSSGAFSLGDNQKRWIVTGICLNKILLPTLRDFVETDMIKHYNVLKIKHRIDKQSHAKHILKDGKCSNLNYGNINNNEAKHKKKVHLYDYDVKSEVDLAKLYLQPFMAKFTGFDNTCDLSAVLGLLCSSSVFSTAVQSLASDVRKDVRNEWGHCNFVKWNDVKYAKCFQLMDSLVRALSLAPSVEKRIVDELKDWETKGLRLCMGNIVDADIVKFIEVEVAQLCEDIKFLDKRQSDEALRVQSGLQSVQEAIEKFKTDIKSLRQSQDNLSQVVDQLSTETSALADNMETLKIDQKDLQVEVDSIEENQDVLAERVDEGEKKYASLDERVVALETAIQTRSSQQTIITFQAPNRIPCFHGRVNELLTLAKLLQKKTTPCSVTAVYGLGGTGKTSLAIEHIWRNDKDYSGGVFWLSGESNRLFDLSIREMARKIGTFDEDFKTTLSNTFVTQEKWGSDTSLRTMRADETFYSVELLVPLFFFFLFFF